MKLVNFIKICLCNFKYITLRVEEFNIKQGLYIFEFDELDTEFHSHPVVEIILAKKGDFNLFLETESHYNLKLAIIPSNQKHKLVSTNCELKIIMIEHHNKFVIDSIKLLDIDINNGHISRLITDQDIIHINNLLEKIRFGQTLNEYDSRILNTIEYLNQNDLEYSLMIKTLQSITNLSESRLSHLFKSNIGISLKKYLIWSKLKLTIESHLDSKVDLFSALIKSGFYDQPHFSKSFKSMLGVKPSKAYNSRNIQVLKKSGL